MSMSLFNMQNIPHAPKMVLRVQNLVGECYMTCIFFVCFKGPSLHGTAPGSTLKGCKVHNTLFRGSVIKISERVCPTGHA